MHLLKLINGYNVGLPKKGSKVEVLGKSNFGLKSDFTMPVKNKALPTVALISTGGTIASHVDYKTGAVHPMTKPAELLGKIPELKKIANISVSAPLSIFSEEMNTEHWSKIAGFVARELNKDNVRGVVVTHGTDTLHYTSAALSFALEGLSKPVAIVGGQRSSDRGSFDGGMNLICGVHYAVSDIAEVATVLHGTSSDDYCIANRGTKVKKLHTSKRDAFRPINTVPLAKIYPNGKLEKHNGYELRHAGKIKVKSNFEKKVALIKYYPGMSPDILNCYKNYKGIILEGTGLGHVSTTTWLEPLTKLIKKGIFVGMTSQANYGRVDPYVYSTGRSLTNHGVVYLEDMLSETAYVKLSWVLGQTNNIEKVRHLMVTNLRGELSSKSHPNAFLY
jgi:glutamyl-tRNA(Gln) amidotransferase subunit D